MRSFLPVFNILGVVIVLFAATMLVPLVAAFLGDDAALRAYDIAILITGGSGLALWFCTRKYRRELQPRDGVLLVSLVWTILPAFATLPLIFYFQTTPAPLSVTDAYFEAMSGLTTTGATVLAGLDHLPPSINLWRCLLVWIGGMGIIVLAVAILPLLGVGGSQIYKAETPGPMKDNKLTPRIAETAKGLYAVYLGLSLACFLSFRWAGMTWFDAFCHMCATMGLGGFSTHDESFGWFRSETIEWVTVFFMWLAGFNFAQHFVAFQRRSLRPYWAFPEGRWFTASLVVPTFAITAFLMHEGVYADFSTALRYAAFNTVSVATTTGFATTDYATWPVFAPVLMVFLSCFTTCAGSTGGGIKMVRAIILLKQARRELLNIIHPRAISPIRIGAELVENKVIFSILAFMLMYGMTVIILSMLLMLTGQDVVTAVSAILACVNNMGPGLGKVGPASNFSVLTDFQTWVCSFAMLLGRLELFTVLVLFTRAFWRN
jgi:trk system potassium uptake protein TrkH